MSEVLKSCLKQIRFGLAIFFGCLIVCAFLKPQGFWVNHGISYYGTFLETIIPYAIGFSAAIWSFYRVASVLAPYRNLRIIRQLMLAAAICMAGVLITPYSVSASLYDIHVLFGSLLFSAQLVAATWLAWKVVRSRLLELVVIFMIAVGVVCFLSLSGEPSVETRAQIVYQIAFGYVLLHSFKVMLERALAANEADKTELIS